MTYSIGFRAPSSRDLVNFFGDHVALTVTNAGDFFTDPDLQRQDNPGELINELCVHKNGRWYGMN